MMDVGDGVHWCRLYNNHHKLVPRCDLGSDTNVRSKVMDVTNKT
jgi:hypothetical protein